MAWDPNTTCTNAMINRMLYISIHTCNYISPHSAILTVSLGLRCQWVSWGGRHWTDRLLAPVGTFSIFLTVNRPSVTRPKMTCFPSRNSAGAVVMKNCN